MTTYPRQNGDPHAQHGFYIVQRLKNYLVVGTRDAFKIQLEIIITLAENESKPVVDIGDKRDPRSRTKLSRSEEFHFGGLSYTCE